MVGFSFLLPPFPPHTHTQDAVDAYELLETEEQRRAEAPEIVRRFLTRPATSDSGVDTCEDSQAEGGDSATDKFVDSLSDESISAAVRGVDSGAKDLFAACAADVRVHLAGQPFRDFVQSMYFHR